MIQIQVVTAALLLRFILYRECSWPEAFVYCTCFIALGFLFMEKLEAARLEAAQKLGPQLEPRHEREVDDVRKLALNTHEEVEELKTKVNGLTLRDGLKL